MVGALVVGCNALLGFEEGTPQMTTAGVAGSGGATASAGSTSVGGLAGGMGGTGGGAELCTGDPATGDSDEDGYCDDVDQCDGDDDSGDSDADGYCDDIDRCDGLASTPAQNVGPDTCAIAITAIPDEDRSARYRKYHATLCEPGSNLGSGAPATWDIYAEVGNVNQVPASKRANGLLSFATGASLPDDATVVEARLVLWHAGTNSSAGVALYGGDQPIFHTPLTWEDFDVPLTLLDSETMADITQQGFADFTIQVGQIQTDGDSQFRVQLLQACPFPNDPHGWIMHSPTAPVAANRPTLHVTYQVP